VLRSLIADVQLQAVQNGAAAVVAVGGDGTLNEVLNGFFKDGEAVHLQEVQAGPRTAIGVPPYQIPYVLSFLW
jgi:diacylglycerol kinase family enzyme